MSEPAAKRWVVPAQNLTPEWETAGRELGIPRPGLIALWNRGLRTAEDATRFLDPRLEHLADPYLLTDVALTVRRLRQALAGGERIAVFGDYDVDGMTAIALWARFLRFLGAAVEVLVPDRMQDGFGISRRAVDEANARGATVLVVNDCGTTAHQAADRARELGIDLLVADHHVPEGPLAAVFALVNPQRAGETYPTRDLAAVGVAFKILQALVGEIGPKSAQDYLLRQLDLVALGTVADVVPLRGENRVLVHFGLEELRERPSAAISALVRHAGLQDKLLDAGHLAYSLAPRLNASGRLGAPERALRLLITDDPAAADLLAGFLEEDNRERRRLNERVLADALRQIGSTPAGGAGQLIVLASHDWHPGVLGIAASRLVERFRVPAILISLQGQPARGSGRTPPGVDLLELIASSSRHLSAYGGHRQAVGLSLPPDQFESFRRDVCLAAHRTGLVASENVLNVDGELDPTQCDLETVRWLEQLAPFGAGNPEPLFLGRAVCRDARVQQGRHLRFRAGSGHLAADCIGFGLGARASELPSGGAVLEFVYHPTINRHRGADQVQLKLREFRLGGRTNSALPRPEAGPEVSGRV
jgi:single-stranded-DNA-specific exonuclease